MSYPLSSDYYIFEYFKDFGGKL